MTSDLPTTEPDPEPDWSFDYGPLDTPNCYRCLTTRMTPGEHGWECHDCGLLMIG